MDNDALVGRLVQAGSGLLRHLDARGFPIDDAFWLWDEDTHTWRLYIATPLAETEGPLHVYKIMSDYIPDGDSLTLSDISVVSPHNQLVKQLRDAVHSSPVDIVGQRIIRNALNNIFIEDGYIYRVA